MLMKVNIGLNSLIKIVTGKNHSKIYRDHSSSYRHSFEIQRRLQKFKKYLYC